MCIIQLSNIHELAGLAVLVLYHSSSSSLSILVTNCAKFNTLFLFKVDLVLNCKKDQRARSSDPDSLVRCYPGWYWFIYLSASRYIKLCKTMFDCICRWIVADSKYSHVPIVSDVNNSHLTCIIIPDNAFTYNKKKDISEFRFLQMIIFYDFIMD